MSVPAWLVAVLDDHLPMLRGVERDQLAERIVEALPARVIAKTIAASAQAVLATRNIKDGAGDISIEIGRNAAQTVVFTLAGDE